MFSLWYAILCLAWVSLSFFSFSWGTIIRQELISNMIIGISGMLVIIGLGKNNPRLNNFGIILGTTFSIFFAGVGLFIREWGPFSFLTFEVIIHIIIAILGYMAWKHEHKILPN